MNQFSTIKALKKNIKACTLCADYLPYQPRPVFSFSAKSKILIVGQAPGIKVHKSGLWKLVSIYANGLHWHHPRVPQIDVL